MSKESKKKANKKYEKRLIEEEKLLKVTMWVPADTKPDFELMASYCREHRDHTPYMVRNLINGQMKKAV